MSASAQTNGAAAARTSLPTRAQVKRARLAAADKTTVIPDLALWGQSSRIGGGITPSRIGAILREADGGDMRSLQDLANECRQRDPHLQAVLATKEESLAGLAWQITPPDEARSKDKRAAQWAEAVLRANPHLPLLIAHLAGAAYYSYAVAEIAWKKDAGKMVPGAFLPVAPRRFGFRIEDGMFVWRDEGKPAVDFRAEYPRKFIVSQPRITGDVANREGLARSLVWMSVFRNWIISDWLKTAEISWKPWRIGTYKKNGTNNDDRADLETAMRRLTTDGMLVKSDACEVDIKWPGGTTSGKATHAEFVVTLANEMSKAVLGQTETTQSSSSSGYAQAKVHDAVRRDLLESSAKHVASILTRDLVAHLIDLNFNGIRMPRFEFLTQDPVDLKAFSEALEKLRASGLKIPSAWAYDQTGIPEPGDGEACLGDGEETPEDDADKPKQPTEDEQRPDGAPEGETPSEGEKPDASDDAE